MSHCDLAVKFDIMQLIGFKKNLALKYSKISFFVLPIDRASLAEKSVRKDEKTLCWPPLLITHLVTKSSGKKTG